jgi:hypothetical protein
MRLRHLPNCQLCGAPPAAYQWSEPGWVCAHIACSQQSCWNWKTVTFYAPVRRRLKWWNWNGKLRQDQIYYCRQKAAELWLRRNEARTEQDDFPWTESWLMLTKPRKNDNA